MQGKYEKALALVTKFRNQKPPQNYTRTQYDEFQKKKLTHAKVLAVIYRYIRRQYVVPRKEVALVKTNYTYKLKAYAPHMLDNVECKEAPIYQLTLNDGGLPTPVKDMSPNAAAQYAQAMRVIHRKHANTCDTAHLYSMWNPTKLLPSISRGCASSTTTWKFASSTTCSNMI